MQRVLDFIEHSVQCNVNQKPTLQLYVTVINLAQYQHFDKQIIT